jgi:hypothetical protein
MKKLFFILIIFKVLISFTIDPLQWEQPRFYHTAMGEKWQQLFQISKGSYPAALLQPIHSENQSYYFMAGIPQSDEQGTETVKIYVYNEKPEMLHLQFDKLYSNFRPQIKWINEKLLHIRINWSRNLGADMIFDVEREQFIYQEMRHDGTLLFQQHKESDATK